MQSSVKKPVRVEVLNPTTVSTSVSLTAGFLAAGCDAVFHTGFSYKPSRWAGLLSCLPSGLAHKVMKQLSRRQCFGLEEQRVRNHALREVVLLGLVKCTSGRVQRFFADLRLASFDYCMGLRYRLKPSVCKNSIVVAGESSGYFSLSAASKAGAVTVLNQVIGHLDHGRELLDQEALDRPDLFPKGPYPYTPSFLKHVRQESLIADWVLSPSNYVRDTLLERGVPEERILFQPYSVDCTRFQPAVQKVQKDRCTFVFCGQVSARKGLHHLAEAACFLDQEDYDVHLYGAEMISREIFEGLPIEMKGQVPYGQIEEVYRSGDVFVYPSLHEGSAVAILEAMASGLPVITTYNSGSMVRDGVEGLIVPIRDPQALAKAMRVLMRDPERRRTMGGAARERALQFTPARCNAYLKGNIARMLEKAGG